MNCETDSARRVGVSRRGGSSTELSDHRGQSNCRPELRLAQGHVRLQPGGREMVQRSDGAGGESSGRAPTPCGGSLKSPLAPAFK